MTQSQREFALGLLAGIKQSAQTLEELLAKHARLDTYTVCKQMLDTLLNLEAHVGSDTYKPVTRADFLDTARIRKPL